MGVQYALQLQSTESSVPRKGLEENTEVPEGKSQVTYNNTLRKKKPQFCSKCQPEFSKSNYQKNTRILHWRRAENVYIHTLLRQSSFDIVIYNPSLFLFFKSLCRNAHSTPRAQARPVALPIVTAFTNGGISITSVREQSRYSHCMRFWQQLRARARNGITHTAGQKEMRHVQYCQASFCG